MQFSVANYSVCCTVRVCQTLKAGRWPGLPVMVRLGEKRAERVGCYRGNPSTGCRLADRDGGASTCDQGGADGQVCLWW